MADQMELGSPEWMETAFGYLEREIPALGSELDGVSWSVCEVLTEAPAHIVNTDRGEVAWWLRVDGPTVECGKGLLEGAHNTIEADYQTILPMSRAVYPSNGASDAQRQADQKAINETIAKRRAASGEAGGTGSEAAAPMAVPAALRQVLHGLHDFMAPLTA